MLRRGLLFFAETRKLPECRAFLAKKKNGNFLSKLPFFCGGGGENRTPVRKPLNQTFYERIRWFYIPSPDLPPAGYRL